MQTKSYSFSYKTNKLNTKYNKLKIKINSSSKIRVHDPKFLFAIFIKKNQITAFLLKFDFLIYMQLQTLKLDVCSLKLFFFIFWSAHCLINPM